MQSLLTIHDYPALYEPTLQPLFQAIGPRSQDSAYARNLALVDIPLSSLTRSDMSGSSTSVPLYLDS